MAKTNTEANIGIRINFGAMGDRNFESSGSVAYVANRRGLDFLGTTYNVGDTLPFDAGGAYSPGAIQTLQLYWNQGFIKPLV